MTTVRLPNQNSLLFKSVFTIACTVVGVFVAKALPKRSSV